MLLSKGALRLQPGQWVAGEKGIGRYLRTDHRTGTTYVSWVRPGDDWTTQSQRFHRACMKGYVGKYASRYEGLKPARLGGRRLGQPDAAAVRPCPLPRWKRAEVIRRPTL